MVVALDDNLVVLLDLPLAVHLVRRRVVLLDGSLELHLVEMSEFEWVDLSEKQKVDWSVESLAGQLEPQ